jgi:hypothetical protein
MPFKSQRSIWLWPALTVMMSISFGASAMPNPIAKVGSASKTVLQKSYDGAKTLAKTSRRVVKDAGGTAWHASDSLVNHIRSAF